MSSGESTTLFASDRVAMLIGYFDRTASTVAEDSTIVTPDQVRYTLPPTREDHPAGRVRPFRSGPAVVSIFGHSQNAEAAYKLLEAASTAESQLDMARATAGGAQIRTSLG